MKKEILNTNSKDSSRLIDAMKKNQFNFAKYLLRKGAKVNEKDIEGKTALHHAIIEYLSESFWDSLRKIHIVRRLIKYDADINLKDNNGNSPLMFALRNLRLLKFLLKNGANVNTQDKENKTALHHALENCRGERELFRTTHIAKLVLLLLKRGIDINLKDNKGNSPLMYAIKGGCFQFVKLLLEKGADITVPEKNILHLVKDGFSEMTYKEEIRDILMEYGAKYSPFYIAYKPDITCIHCGNNIPVNGPYKKASCPYCTAITNLTYLWENVLIDDDYVHLETTEFKGSDKDGSVNFIVTNKNGVSDFIEANEDGAFDTSLLNKKGNSINTERKEPHCLHCNSKLDISENNFGTNKAIICKNCGTKNSSIPAPDWMKKLTLHKMKPQQIFCSDIKGDEEQAIPMTFRCKSCGANLSLSYDSPRSYNCEHCRTIQDVPEQLWFELNRSKEGKKWYILYGGAVIEKIDRPKETENDKLSFSLCRSILGKYGYGIYQDGTDTVYSCDEAPSSSRNKWIGRAIKKGANINFPVNKAGHSLLMFSVIHCSLGEDEGKIEGEIEMTNLLLEYGSDVNQQDNKGNTALHLALLYNGDKYYVIIKKLIEHGANVNLKNKNGDTALSVAVIYGLYRTIVVLLQNGADINATSKNILHKIPKNAHYAKKITDLLIEYGAKNPSFSIEYQPKINCPKCKHIIPYNGPTRKIQCESCNTIKELDDNFWEIFFEQSRSMKTKDPHCSNPKCKKKLDISNYNYGTEKPVICSKCGTEHISYPAPEWMKKYKIANNSPHQIFCGEKENGNNEIVDIRPVEIKCISCAANLLISEEAPRLCACKYCNTEQYLPDTIWEKLHPVKTRKFWYIRYM